MKRLITLFLVAAVTMFFYSCSENNSTAPEFSQSDQVTSTLAKEKIKRTFTGICTNVFPPNIPGNNEWYDAADDWRVTGTTIWVQNPAVFGGTATLFVDAKNPHDENRGKWEMEWTGKIVLVEGGALIVATATGVGVEGKVKGMTANWTYTMNYVGDLPPTPNESFFYVIEGNIDKPQGPIKK